MFKNFLLDKKTLLMAIGVAVVGVIIWLSTASPKQEPEEVAPEEQSAEQSSTQIPQDQIATVVERVDFYQFYPSGLYFFRSDDNSFYHRSTENDQTTKIFEVRGIATNQRVFEVVFLAEEPKAIVRIAGREEPINRIIDLIESKETKLISQISQPQWSGNNQIIYLYDQNQEITHLSRLNLLTDKWQNIKKLSFGPAEVKISKEKIFVSHLAALHSDFYYLISLDLSGAGETKIANEIYDFLPSPTGNKVALLMPRGGMGALAIKDLSTNETIETDLKTADASKLAWQDDSKLLVATSTTAEAEKQEGEGLIAVTVPGGATETIWDAEQDIPIVFSGIKIYQDQIYFLYNQSLCQIVAESSKNQPEESDQNNEK